MENKYTFHIPMTTWTCNHIDDICKVLKQKSGVSGVVYGSLPMAFATGRPNDFSDSKRENVDACFKYARENGLKTKYLLNGIHPDGNFEKTKNYLIWVCEKLKPDLIGVSDYLLAKYIFERHGRSNFSISTIAGCRGKDDIENWILLTGIDNFDTLSVTLHHDNTTIAENEQKMEFQSIRNMGINPDLLTTESCVLNCPMRNDHYEYFGEIYSKPWRTSFLDVFQVKCVLNRLLRPHKLLDLAGFIPPNEINKYCVENENLGIKLSGRSKTKTWVLNCLNHYVNEMSPENIYDIIVFTTPIVGGIKCDSSELFYVESATYRLIKNRLKSDCKDIQSREVILKDEAKKLFEKGKLKINDHGAIYDIHDGELVCIRLGKYARRLVAILDKLNNKTMSCELSSEITS